MAVDCITKYLVCKDFTCDDTSSLIHKLAPLFDYFINNTNQLSINRLFNLDIPYLFTSKMEEYNAIFGQQQIENILTTLNLIENYKTDKVEVFKKHKAESYPIAIIQNGTLENEKIVKGNLNNIQQLVQQEEITSPAIIIVGEVIEENSLSN